MMWELFFKECKQILKSLTYYILLACLILFYLSQSPEIGVISKPEPNQEYYGHKYVYDKSYIMESVTVKLALDYNENHYDTYPIGFYREVVLSEEKQDKIRNILEEITGLSGAEITNTVRNYKESATLSPQSQNFKEIGTIIKPKENLTYEEFEELINKGSKLVGGGYVLKGDLKKVSAPLTYEEAMEEYEDILNKDHISNAYARIFCDYIGIVLGLLPIFLAVTRCLRDKRAKANEVIFAKEVSSAKVILTRYLSTVIMMLIPIILLSISLTLECNYYGSARGIQVDNFAFIKHILGWLLPTIMVVTAIGFFFTELTGSAIGIMVQGIWWMISIFSASGDLTGYVGWNLIPRFNSVGCHEVFTQVYKELIINRLVYVIMSAILVFLTILIYERKRKGALSINGKIFRSGKSKFKA